MAILHLALVWWVSAEDFEGSWGGMVLFVADLPVSLLLFLPIPANQWFLFAIVGTVWWYFIGVFLNKLVQKKIA